MSDKYINTNLGVFKLRKNGRVTLKFENGEVIRCTSVPYNRDPGDTIKISDILNSEG